MPVTARAAICFEPGKPLRIETIEVADPEDNEVQIRILASGLCHSDLHFIDGRNEAPLPMVFGHEAIGRVIKAGSKVTEVAVGDMVIPYLLPDCGKCPLCLSGKTNLCAEWVLTPEGKKAPYSFDGKPVYATAQIGAFSEIIVIPEIMAVKVPDNVPVDTTCCVACAVATGAGTVLLSARAQKGETVAIFGAGGIGLCAIQGARIAGASRIFAIDTNPAKEAVARKLGATDFINPNIDGDPVARIMQETGIGVDYSFECVGHNKLLCQALDATNMAWGKAFQIGMLTATDPIPTTPYQMAFGRSWTGAAMGGAKRKDVANFVDMTINGQIDLDDLVSHRLTLDQINEGFDMMRQGKSVRSVILFDTAAP